MDLILTGRAVDAEEALGMGLATRVVPDGTAREAAESLAREIARFPQTCMRGDRRSAIGQWDQPVDAAMAREFEIGLAAIQSDAVGGARRFAGGAGRGGRFDDC
jgi:enoyl-CoA hydratase